MLLGSCVANADAQQPFPRAKRVYQKFSLSAAFSVRVLRRVAPNPDFHHLPVYFAEVVQVLEKRREVYSAVSICKDKGKLDFGDTFDGGNEVDNRCLPTGISFDPAIVDGVEHRSTWGKIERNVVVQHTSRSAGDRCGSPSILDVLMGDVLVIDSAGVLFDFAPKTTFRKNTLQVIDVGDMVDERLYHVSGNC